MYLDYYVLEMHTDIFSDVLNNDEYFKSLEIAEQIKEIKKFKACHADYIKDFIIKYNIPTH